MSKFNLTRRWVRARPGSVLILVIALLVLLALIGTAYLSSTQTERYSSVQNSINTEADLLIGGLQVSVESEVSGGLYGGSTYRPPQQEQPTYQTIGSPTYPTPTGYYNYDSTVVDPNLTAPNAQNLPLALPDLFLADRIPYLNGVNPTWNRISWPLFKDSSGNYNFDSPAGNSVTISIPTSANNVMLSGTPNAKSINGQSFPTLTLTGPNSVTYGPILAASASGDGIADAGLVKLPIGPIDGVTYYCATRVVDDNSAINASSANTQGTDIALAGATTTNYGMFRSNIGMQELAINSATTDFTNLNSHRFPTSPSYSATPVPDSSTAGWPTNFSWYSAGDEIENQLTRRPGNPGLANTTFTPGNPNGTPFIWMGQAATAALAYKYSLTNPAISPLSDTTSLEYYLPYELYLNPASNTPYQSTPWSPSDTNSWWNSNFVGLQNYLTTGSNTNPSIPSTGSPLRTILVGNNAVSNAVPAWYGNASSTPPPWTAVTTTGAPQTYKFGDWVVDGPPGAQRSFVCIQQQNAGTVSTANEPEPTTAGAYTYASNPATPTVKDTSFNPGAVSYWAGAQSAAPTLPNGRLPGLPWSSIPVKANVNTATFSQLWLAFCQVMTDSNSINPIPAGDSTGSANAQVAQWQPPMQPITVVATAPQKLMEQQMGQFRSVIRDSHIEGSRLVLTSAQMLKLRAAIAAVNTMDMRDSDDDVTSKNITLTDDSGAPQYDVEVYGNEKQPYISEIMIRTDGTPVDAPGIPGTPLGAASPNYIAVELCNPYPTPITLTGWQIGSLNRSAWPTLTLAPGIAISAAPIAIPAASSTGVPGLLILEEGTRPSDIGATISNLQGRNPTTTYPTLVSVPGLYSAAVPISPTLGTNQPCEIFIMRPRLGSGPSASISTNDTYDESNPIVDLQDYVPVDQMDLTGLAIPPKPATPAVPQRFVYRRGNDGTVTPNRSWQFVYPGAYDPAAAAGRYFYDISEGQPAILPEPDTYPCFLGGPTGEEPGPPPITTTDTTYTSIAADGVTYPTPTYNTLAIELNNANMGGPNPVGATNRFPFGAFARNADMLKIPFIGAYRIRPIGEQNKTGAAGQMLTELNSVTMDSALAFDNTGGTYALGAYAGVPPNSTKNLTAVPPTTAQFPFSEQIGHFCPIGDPTSTTANTMLDFGPGYDNTIIPIGAKVYWHYHWAKKLFDYLAVQSPQDDYFPNADPAQGNANVTPTATQPKYPGGTIPAPVANSNPSYANAQIAGHSEDTVGVEGLININTAPVAVLAQLPFYSTDPTLTGTALAIKNATLAQDIVNYRNAHGPFQSIFDLYRVTGLVGFENANNAMFTSAPAGPQQGVFSPGPYPFSFGGSPPTGVVRYDFQERFLLLNNISNLITTRSDTFTCYVLLQGWRNVGTGNPSLVVQRRIAFLVDRNGITPTNNQPSSYKIPSN